MRTFIALNLPAAERDRLHESVAPLRAHGLPVRWVDAAALHITLKFLGEVESGEVSGIDEAMREIAVRHAPLQLVIGGFGAFPSLRRAGVLWIGVQPDRQLIALQRDVELAFSRLGYTREHRPYRPHITLARTSSGARAPDVERAGTDVSYSGSADVRTMDLMRSHTGPDGARYEPLLRIPLGPQVDE